MKVPTQHDIDFREQFCLKIFLDLIMVITHFFVTLYEEAKLKAGTPDELNEFTSEFIILWVITTVIIIILNIIRKIQNINDDTVFEYDNHLILVDEEKNLRVFEKESLKEINAEKFVETRDELNTNKFIKTIYKKSIVHKTGKKQILQK